MRGVLTVTARSAHIQNKNPKQERFHVKSLWDTWKSCKTEQTTAEKSRQEDIIKIRGEINKREMKKTIQKH